MAKETIKKEIVVKEKKQKGLTSGVSVRGIYYAKGTPKSEIAKEDLKAIGEKLFK